ncbi:hypothetical protein QYF36_021525 [Acer negundo]|nr:hypothetical protein QYF36_021525 [Acer negundo]
MISLLVAILSVLFTSTFLINPNTSSTFVKYFTDFNIVTTFTSTYTINSHDHLHKHHKHSDDNKGKTVSICDDFPSDFVPPDTNTTSYLCVDRNGCCNFTTVQSAVDAIGNFSQKRNIILINTGFYYEKVIVPIFKPNITFQGQGYTSTAIAWNDTANSANGDKGAQAVAIRISGDESAFWGCGFFGAQDTLHDDKGRHYFRDCYIQGSIDFIFGNASVGGNGRIWLGRAWRPFSRVVFAYTTMSDIIAPEGWNDFNDPARDPNIFYGEYNCSGAGANMTMRAPYVQRLNDTLTSYFLNMSFIDAQQWLQS